MWFKVQTTLGSLPDHNRYFANDWTDEVVIGSLLWEKVNEIKDRKVTILLGTKHQNKEGFVLIIKKAFAGHSLLPGMEIN